MKNQEIFKATLASMIRHGADARAEFAKAAATHRVNNLWSQSSNLVTIAVGDRATDLVEILEDAKEDGKDLDVVLAGRLDRLRDELVEGYLESHSTSSMANAFADQHREAARRFLSQMVNYVAGSEEPAIPPVAKGELMKALS